MKELDDVKQIVESFKEVLQKILKEHYDKLHVNLCMYWRLKGEHEEKNWECISENEAEEALIMYHSIQDDFKDNMIHCIDSENSEKYKPEAGVSYELLWVWCSEKKSEAVRLVLEIVTTELSKKITDTLYLHKMFDLRKGMDFKKKEDWDKLIKNPTYKYFLGNLMDKEWLNRKYVRGSLKKYGLPSWRTFFEISAMFYEKRSICTSMYFFEKTEDIEKKYVLQFDATTRDCDSLDSNLRSVRKLMEISGSENGLAIKLPEFIIEGVVEKTDSEDAICYVEFDGHLSWRLRAAEETIFEYCEGEYKLPELELKDEVEAQFKKQLERLKEVSWLNEEQRERINIIINNIRAKASHGAAIVFMSDDILKDEIKRLGKFCRVYPVIEFDLCNCKESLGGILGIDGAILAGMDGMGLAIGAILDGEIIVKGRSDRGSRYNSLVNYVHILKDQKGCKQCFAVIFSEDGMIDIEIPGE